MSNQLDNQDEEKKDYVNAAIVFVCGKRILSGKLEDKRHVSHVNFLSVDG